MFLQISFIQDLTQLIVQQAPGTKPNQTWLYITRSLFYFRNIFHFRHICSPRPVWSLRLG